MQSYMEKAVTEALLGVKNRDGGPFGAVIVRNDEIIATGHNMVIASNDPTAHAEIVAIRNASAKLGRFDLSDCTLYTTCEPCPMCYSAAHWAKIKTVYYGATRNDAAEAGFDDHYIYEVLSGNIENEQMKLVQKDRAQCIEAFKIYNEDEKRQLY